MQKAILSIAGCILFGSLVLPAMAVDVSSSSSATVTACVGSSCSSVGGGGYAIPTSVTFSGRAYALSRVILLKDGQDTLNTVSGPDARFTFTISNLTAGTYTFSILSEDSRGRRSTLFTIPVAVSAGVASTISGVFLAPTIAIDKTTVKRGDPLTIFGETAPGSEVTIAVHSENKIFATTYADENGAYFYTINTSPLEYGKHITQSKAEISSTNETTSYGKVLSFAVGTKNENIKDGCDLLQGDFNADCRVNIVDFSILAFWYKKANFPQKHDLNSDNKISFVDFSILAYYWTG
jgi:hypothetical protein